MYGALRLLASLVVGTVVHCWRSEILVRIFEVGKVGKAGKALGLMTMRH